MLSLVVRWNRDVDVLKGRVRVAEGDGGQVAVSGLPVWLGIGPWVRDNQQPWLLVLVSDLIREGT